MSKNYSFATSMEPYLENKATAKRRQCDNILAFIRRGSDNLLQISELSGIPQAICSARLADLRNESKADYSGFVIYKDRKRKRIVLVEKTIVSQPELFN